MALRKISKKIIIVDLNPEIVEDLNCKGIRCIYGDAYDAGLLEKLNIEKAQMIVTTFPAKKSNLYLIKKVKSKNKRAKIITTAEQAAEALELYNSGADYVILPHYISGEHVASLLERKDKDSLKQARKYHIGFLKDVVREKK
jgi:Trk K+ transport system NAD-binding subunit